MEAGNGGTKGSSRWSPTKEQINMLEGLYKQGVRTPSADQIQQITSRLRAYGQIEGKNVFYWFQNHKARQRQKQKQDSLSYFNRLLHRTTRLLYPPPCLNVGSGAYYLKQGDAGTHPQSHQVLVPGGRKKKPGCGYRSDKTTKLYGYGGVSPFSHQDRLIIRSPEINNSFHCDDDVRSGDSNQKTLPLFPLQPTGVSCEGATASMEDSDSNPSSTSSETANRKQPFFDFFTASNSSSDSGTV